MRSCTGNVTWVCIVTGYFFNFQSQGQASPNLQSPTRIFMHKSGKLLKYVLFLFFISNAPVFPFSIFQIIRSRQNRAQTIGKKLVLYLRSFVYLNLCSMDLSFEFCFVFFWFEIFFSLYSWTNTVKVANCGFCQKKMLIGIKCKNCK